ncbi:MAG: Ppx/GppA family phosphatase, partial [Alphaproteobacteria bacterium]
AIEKRCGVTVKTIPGDEEARLSALGVIAGCPEADGIVGDLGGGSLELIVVAKGAVSQHATLPLGALRLHELAAGGADIRDVINGHLAMLPWLESAKAKNFYAVGGAWRSLARIHMAQSEYRLRVIDNYAVDADEFREFAKVISQQRATTLSKFPDLPARRASTLPIASLILRRVLARIAPRRLVFSAHGLREGIVFDALSAAEQKRDPLLDATIEFSRQFARFSGFSDALVRWTAGLYGDEPVEDARLRRAMCYLSDIGWSEHPDYRARHAFERVLTLPVMGLDHPARAFLAHAIHARYGGDDDEIGRKFGRRIGLDEAREDRARALGLALRLGYTVSAGQESLLNATSLARQGQSVVLTVPARGAAAFVGEAVERRLKDLAEQLNLKPRIDGGGR